MNKFLKLIAAVVAVASFVLLTTIFLVNNYDYQAVSNISNVISEKKLTFLFVRLFLIGSCLYMFSLYIADIKEKKLPSEILERAISYRKFLYLVSVVFIFGPLVEG